MILQVCISHKQGLKYQDVFCESLELEQYLYCALNINHFVFVERDKSVWTVKHQLKTISLYLSLDKQTS